MTTINTANHPSPFFQQKLRDAIQQIGGPAPPSIPPLDILLAQPSMDSSLTSTARRRRMASMKTIYEGEIALAQLTPEEAIKLEGGEQPPRQQGQGQEFTSSSSAAAALEFPSGGLAATPATSGEGKQTSSVPAEEEEESEEDAGSDHQTVEVHLHREQQVVAAEGKEGEAAAVDGEKKEAPAEDKDQTPPLVYDYEIRVPKEETEKKTEKEPVQFLPPPKRQLNKSGW